MPMASDEAVDALTSLRRKVYKLLDEIGIEESPQVAVSVAPPTDVVVRGNVIELTVEVPGLRRDDLEIEASDNVLTISGRGGMEEEGRYLRRERPAGRFRRSFALPWRIDAERVSARLERGVLTVTVPRAGVTRVEVGE